MTGASSIRARICRSRLPALSLPCGLTRQALPIGLQMIAPPFREATLLQVAAAFEAATDFHTRKEPGRVCLASRGQETLRGWNT